MFRSINHHVTYGTDPEFFFERADGSIIGAEKVIPAAGLRVAYSTRPNVILDGVQVELNPASSGYISILAGNIATAIELISRTLSKRNDGVRLSYKRFVDVGRAELDSLSEGCRELGCQPSDNVYGIRPITVDKKHYTKRSTGGHIHLGLPEDLRDNSLIAWCDVFSGLIGTLFDRDPGAAERRENYGRAGEYRVQPHGLEYRTHSSWWMRNYTLMSLAFGTVKIAVAVAQDDELRKELFETCDINQVIEAIDLNSYSQALRAFEAIRPFLVRNLPKSGGEFQLSPDNLDRMLTVADAAHQKGIEAFFPEDPLTHWVSLNRGVRKVEFGEFLKTIY